MKFYKKKRLIFEEEKLKQPGTGIQFNLELFQIQIAIT